jgi:hypothetical protein
VADHVIAGMTGIAQVSRSLRVLGNEFAAMTQVAEAGGAAGSGAGSAKRDALIGELRHMSGPLSDAGPVPGDPETPWPCSGST